MKSLSNNSRCCLASSLRGKQQSTLQSGMLPGLVEGDWALKGIKMIEVGKAWVESPGARNRALVTWPTVWAPAFKTEIQADSPGSHLLPNLPSSTHRMGTSEMLLQPQTKGGPYGPPYSPSQHPIVIIICNSFFYVFVQFILSVPVSLCQQFGFNGRTFPSFWPSVSSPRLSAKQGFHTC